MVSACGDNYPKTVMLLLLLLMMMMMMMMTTMTMTMTMTMIMPVTIMTMQSDSLSPKTLYKSRNSPWSHGVSFQDRNWSGTSFRRQHP